MQNLILIIILLVVIVATVVALAYRGKKQIIYKVIYALVNEAEEIYGSKTGKRKFAYVMEQIYARIPAFIRLFITYQMLEKWIEQALAEAKEFWKQKAEEDDKPIVVSGFAQNN